MIQLLTPGARGLQTLAADAVPPADALWIDLFEPTDAEEERVEKFLGIDIPTREEMREIEESSRLYQEGGCLYMTVRVLCNLDTPTPSNQSVTFVLNPRCLTTVRYANPHAFRFFAERFTKPAQPPLTRTDAIFIELMERIVFRIADVLETIEAELDQISEAIFREDAAVAPLATPQGNLRPSGPVPANAAAAGRDGPTVAAMTATTAGALQPIDLQHVLKRLGQRNSLAAKLRESLLSVSRLLPFFLTGSCEWLDGELANRFRTLQRDVQSLNDYTGHIGQEITFLLDSTLGLINIEQNAIIKVFTIAAVLFLPPTVVGTIYGMNFEHMPELKWAFGYPVALMLMVLSGLGPYWYFKRKGWF